MPTMTREDVSAYAAASLRAVVRCQCCQDMFPRSEMSVYQGGFCRACIDANFVICSLCGTPIEHCAPDGFDLCGRTHGHAAGDVWASSGHPCCHSCYSSVSRNDRWRPTPLDVSIATYDKVASTRKFGVEIETSYCPDSDGLNGHTKFGAKYDPTVGGLEFDSPILYGDVGFETIRDFLTYADQHGWEVSSSCGCHTHYDMRDESDDQLWATYYAYNITYPMWSAAVPPRRRGSIYCQVPYATATDIERSADRDGTFRDYSYNAERYDYLNVVAYGDHRTFEVRLLDGTIKADTICNWVALHARLHNMSFAEIRELGRTRSKQFRSLVELIDDAPLTDWLAHRARYTGEMPLRGPNCAS